MLQTSVNAGLQAGMDAHLGYENSDRTAKAQVEGSQGNNFRNGSYTKTVDSGFDQLEVVIPRYRVGTFACPADATERHTPVDRAR